MIQGDLDKQAEQREYPCMRVHRSIERDLKRGKIERRGRTVLTAADHSQDGQPAVDDCWNKEQA
jgi:hypothetical protein